MGLDLDQLQFLHQDPVLILDKSIRFKAYCTLDLSIGNEKLDGLDITKIDQCQEYIEEVLEKNDAKVAYGGYLEKRNLYSDKSSFSNDQNSRNIHLGIDFWSLAGTKVVTPLNGKVHSFQNNATSGDYGPTIILKHSHNRITFHTLYGHLSIASLKNLYIGKEFNKGEVLATLGTPDINVNYAPHLHFQLIKDMQGKMGDYPGVCSEDTLEFYTQNCPNPNLMLKMGGDITD